jgi:hypothetical protein
MGPGYSVILKNALYLLTKSDQMPHALATSARFKLNYDLERFIQNLFLDQRITIFGYPGNLVLSFTDHVSDILREEFGRKAFRHSNLNHFLLDEDNVASSFIPQLSMLPRTLLDGSDFILSIYRESYYGLDNDQTEVLVKVHKPFDQYEFKVEYQL